MIISAHGRDAMELFNNEKSKAFLRITTGMWWLEIIFSMQCLTPEPVGWYSWLDRAANVTILHRPQLKCAYQSNLIGPFPFSESSDLSVARHCECVTWTLIRVGSIYRLGYETVPRKNVSDVLIRIWTSQHPGILLPFIQLEMSFVYKIRFL